MSFFGNLSSFVELLVFSVGQRRKLWCTWLWWWPFGAFKSNTVGKQFLHDHCQSVVPSTQAGLEFGVWWILDSVLFFISPNIYIYIYFFFSQNITCPQRWMKPPSNTGAYAKTAGRKKRNASSWLWKTLRHLICIKILHKYCLGMQDSCTDCPYLSKFQVFFWPFTQILCSL